MKDERKLNGPGRICRRCGRPVHDKKHHPVKMWGQWQCNMRLIGIKKLANGDALTYVPDSPYPSTREDRRFWIHPDRFGY